MQQHQQLHLHALSSSSSSLSSQPSSLQAKPSSIIHLSNPYVLHNGIVYSTNTTSPSSLPSSLSSSFIIIVMAIRMRETHHLKLAWELLATFQDHLSHLPSHVGLLVNLLGKLDLLGLVRLLAHAVNV
jgi:hypothetical protein